MAGKPWETLKGALDVTGKVAKTVLNGGSPVTPPKKSATPKKKSILNEQ